MGITGLLSSTFGFIGTLTNIGLHITATREISESYGSGDKDSLNKTVHLIKKIVWITGILGALITLILSNILSKIAFGSSEYGYYFSVLSVTILINQLSNYYTSLLRSLQRIKLLAIRSFIGATMSFLIVIPCYYFFYIKGIIPAILLSALVNLFTLSLIIKNIEIQKVKLTLREILHSAKKLISFGLVINLTSVFTALKEFLLRSFISNIGNLKDVGLFTAGVAVASQTINLVLNAISMDFFPKLSSVNKDTYKVNDLVNKQIEIGILIILPISIIFICFNKIFIIFFLSDKFLSINKMIAFIFCGYLFRIVSWATAYIILAKGDKKLFFYNEIGNGLFSFLLHICGYYYANLTGLGFAILLNNFIYMFVTYIIVSKKFNFIFNKNNFKNLFFSILFLIISFFITNFDLTYFYKIIIILFSLLFSFYHLNKLISIKEILFSLKIKIWK